MYTVGSTVSFPANAAKLSDHTCTEILKGWKSTETVNCKTENINQESGTGSFLFSIQKYPLKPYMNNIVQHTGNPNVSMFQCNTTLVDSDVVEGVKCVFEDVVSENVPSKYVRI